MIHGARSSVVVLVVLVATRVDGQPATVPAGRRTPREVRAGLARASAVTSASSARTCVRASAPAGLPAVVAASRSALRRTAAGAPPGRSPRRALDGTARALRPGTGTRALASEIRREAVERVGVLAELVGRAGERLGDARAEDGLEDRQHPGADLRPQRGRRGGRRAFVGSSHGSRPSAAQARSVSARRSSRNGRRRIPRSRHAGQGPGSRAAGEPEQHGLGLVVQGVPEQDGRGAVRGRRAPRARVPGRAGRRLGPPPGPDGTVARTTSTGSRPRPRHCSAARAATSALPACRPWSTTTAPARSPARGATKDVAAARASESAPPEHATSTSGTVCTGWEAGPVPAGRARSSRQRRTASRAAATAGGGPVTGVSRAPGGPRPRGRRSRRRWAASTGSVHTALNPTVPTSRVTPRTNAAPSRYWASLASSPRSRLTTPSAAPDVSRRFSNFRRMDRTLGTTRGPTASMATSACPSSRDMTAVIARARPAAPA